MSLAAGPRAPTDADKMRLLPWSLAHTLGNAIFAQLTFFGPVFLLFLDELGLPKTRIGLLLSFMPFAGLVALFIAPAVARIGVKRVFITFWGLRKAVAALLIAVPWVVARSGPDLTFYYVAAVVLLFALCRAIAETAFYPWWQEIVPNAIRGQYSAALNVTDTVGSVAALAGATWAMGHVAGVSRFTVLLVVAVVAGAVCVGCALPLPGGAPRHTAAVSLSRALREAWADRAFRGYLSGLGLITLSLMAFSFVPLFMREQVGLQEGQVLLLQVGVFGGGMFSSYLWGWAADRYGSRPVAQLGLWLMCLPPTGWLLLPRHHPASFGLALALAVVSGVATFGWHVSNNRLLFVGVVPPERRTQYMALYYAWIGLLGGTAPLVGGAILDLGTRLDGRWLAFRIDAYTPLLVAGLAGLVGGRILVGRVRSEAALPTRHLVSLFVRGNPFLAFRALIRYHLAGDESRRVETTRALGDSRSPLNAEELLEALADPSARVRHEAILAISRTRPDPRLSAALAQILAAGGELAPVAAWALGRAGVEPAAAGLRAALRHGSEATQTEAARALGCLDDPDAAGELRLALAGSPSAQVRRASAAALGQLGCVEALPELLACLGEQTSDEGRAEVALALARLVDQERLFVRLWRRSRTRGMAPVSQELLALARRSQLLPGWGAAAARIGSAGEALAEAGTGAATGYLQAAAAALPTSASTCGQQVLLACTARLPDDAPLPTDLLTLWTAALRAAVEATDATRPPALPRAG